jgi:hypothetical protein
MERKKTLAEQRKERLAKALKANIARRKAKDRAPRVAPKAPAK